MNWGSTAVKMITPLGLVAPTRNPSRTIRRSDLGWAATAGENSAASALRSRMFLTPRKIRYAAPSSFSVVKTASDRATIEPTPIDTSTSCSANPLAFPATVARAARRPSDTPRLTTNSTLGPGIRIST